MFIYLAINGEVNKHIWKGTRRRRADGPEPGHKNFSPEKYFMASPLPSGIKENPSLKKF